ncbi:uncharacterized protein YydD (DUF2326 family) [Sedimentibacter acidaminivorans]|uniref:Uncharacterized protein YydD (DUF2326 family) n=1 Tax=Sedimentibacter acidaminivorans TaxID=913099 RepID=A0ABS4GGR7_9FIRM|nr:uncharacterized protein YydD (DUF2326 family) [Sedimentibacter acidaminivorans]
MKLIKLYSNMPTFKDIKFNENGLTIIYAERTKSDRQSTVNGTGKTLSIELVDFCLGADFNPKFKLLKGWKFYLDFKVNNKLYTICRNTEQEKIVYLNDEPKELNKYRKFLYDISTNYQPKIKGITFRNIICKFLKFKKNQYDDAICTTKREDQDKALKRDSLLLGLDYELCEKKISDKEKINKKSNAIREIKKNEVIKQYFDKNDKKLDLKIQNIKAEIEDLKNKLSTFKISEDYTRIENTYNSLKNNKSDLQDNLYLYEKRLSSILESLKINPDIDSANVINFYEQMKIEVPEMIRQKVENVSSFHDTLLKNRQLRLSENKDRIEKSLESIRNKLSELDNKIDEYYNILSTTTSFSEYDSIQERLRQKQDELYKLSSSKSIIDDANNEITELESQMAIDNVETDKYLKDKKDYTDNISSVYMKYAKSIYQNSISGLSIKNNKGNNKNRFEIEPSIQSDTSGGIGLVKIYLYDLLLLTLQNNHNIKFIFNDQHIFSETDPRQIISLLKLLKKINEKNDFQFIFTINNSLYNGILAEFDKEDVQDILIYDYLESSIVQRLNDTGDNGKLLGMTIDLKVKEE